MIEQSDIEVHDTAVRLLRREFKTLGVSLHEEIIGSTWVWLKRPLIVLMEWRSTPTIRRETGVEEQTVNANAYDDLLSYQRSHRQEHVIVAIYQRLPESFLYQRIEHVFIPRPLHHNAPDRYFTPVYSLNMTLDQIARLYA